MRRTLFAHWGLGLLLLFAWGTSGCKTSRAAPPPSYKPPEVGPSNLPIPPEPRITPEEEQEHESLFNAFKKRLPLLEPDKAESNQFAARAKLTETFKVFLPEALRTRIDVTEPTCLPTKTACYVDVSYPDWKTYVEVNRAIIDSQPASPFMTFPGPRYRTGRVRLEKGNKPFSASWLLTLQTRSPREGHKPGRDY